MNRMQKRLCILALALLFACSHVGGEPMGSAFSYQGQLTVAGTPATGLYDFEFALFDAAENGAMVGAPQLLTNIQVDQGVFTVELDFGVSPFAGDQLWLRIAVREADAVSWTDLTPLQKLTAVPYALHAEYVAMDAVGSSSIADGSIGAADVDSSEIQLRVSATCPPNATISEIRADGNIVCRFEVDPQVGGLTEGHYCRASGGTVVCDQLPPVDSRCDNQPCGVITAERLDYTSPREHKVFVPESEFRARDPGATVSFGYGMGGASIDNGQGRMLIASLDLPEDAVITGASCYVTDSSADHDLYCELFRNGLLGWYGTDASGRTTGEPGITALALSGALPKARGENHFYMVGVHAIDPVTQDLVYWPTANELGVRGFVVTYQLNEAP